MPIVINLTKAKVVAHDIRRVKRAEEFVPHDEVIMKQIPGADADAAETARQTIRTKYATAQTNIDSAADVSALTTLVNDL